MRRVKPKHTVGKITFVLAAITLVVGLAAGTVQAVQAVKETRTPTHVHRETPGVDENGQEFVDVDHITATDNK